MFQKYIYLEFSDLKLQLRGQKKAVCGTGATFRKKMRKNYKTLIKMALNFLKKII